MRASCFTFGDGGAVGIGDEAGETHVDRAAEATVHGHRGSEVSDAFPVVELPTDGNHAAPHILAALFTHKAGVDAWEKDNKLYSTGTSTIYLCIITLEIVKGI